MLLYRSVVVLLVFCFKQKTAYEMRISDWSSDVCSSDLEVVEAVAERREHHEGPDQRHRDREHRDDRRAPFLEEDEDDDDDEDHRFEQRFHHRVDRLGDEFGGVIDDAIFEALGEAFRCRRPFGLARSEEHTTELPSLMRTS